MHIKNLYGVTAQHHNIRFRRSLVSNCGVFIIFLLLSAVTLFPVKAYSDDCNETGDIPFKVSNNVLVNNQRLDLCIECTGPWFRTSDTCLISGGVENDEFYAAKKTLLSPFGQWNCKVYLNSSGMGQNCDTMSEDPLNSVDFCLYKGSSGSSVSIDMVSDESSNISLKISGTVDFDTPCSSSVTSFLGDNRAQERSKPDTDLFYFSGTAGDEVKLTLEADPNDGNNGGEAVLRLMGNSLKESVSGAMPLEIISTLPADGQYSIVVKQANTSAGESFRGSYVLRVEPSFGGVGLIEPADNVEK